MVSYGLRKCIPMKKNELMQYSCPLGKAMAALGSKWKPIIVLVIKDRKLRFGELAVRINVISRKVLTDQLREMESDGLIIREEFKELPPRVEYSLTEKGLALLPILYLLEEWEAKYQVKGLYDKDCSLVDNKIKKAVNV
ncbi:transcriptional regulator, HxlR family [Chryseobacterium joostei]|uniref:Transcriptional regulator, HxlR family n=2 Tax=Chryseobacterium joostei TaxID=112234 RepID=A0A1N7JCC3_9FLAO|nr:transcriptional regulator, HxlR family [Chryseobacterium joostei]SIS46960.1 transcriptional regulator, HxlR family [Chryseobacterium joostei]